MRIDPSLVTGLVLFSVATFAQTPTPEATATPAATAEPEPTPSATASPEATPIATEPTPTPAPDHWGGIRDSDDPHAMHGDSFPGMGEGVLGLRHSREGSGTSWQPETTPMHGLHSSMGGWNFMLHGYLFASYLDMNDEPDAGPGRGASGFASMNHVMAMARREIGGGDFAIRTMFSAEPFTVEEQGYPLTAQSGEVFEGEPIHDRQHPHDLFMELAATFIVPLNDSVGFQLYAAPAGEPALGPVAFPHRVSAQSNPLSPLSHHWADSTHVAFGVATAGLFTRKLKIEGSAFNGREPNEDRLDIEFPGIDSWSTRVTLQPIPQLSLQASYGYLGSPEELEPDVSIRRWTASMLYARPLRGRGLVSAAVIWGRNDAGEEHGATNALTVEGEISPDGRGAFLFRGENVRKPGHDLGLEADLGLEFYDVSQFSVGYVYELGPFGGVMPSLGVIHTRTFLDPELAPLYGTDAPVGFTAFLRLRPAPSKHGAHH